MSEKITVGTIVCPKTPAGLCLANVPVNGEFEQKRETVCVFTGQGKVLRVESCIIDYDSWPAPEPEPDFAGDGEDELEGETCDYRLGKVEYLNCLVECDAGTGWAGAGALMTISTDGQ